MGDYDARISELRSQFAAAAPGGAPPTIEKIEDAIDAWASEREQLLENLLDLVERASASNKGTPDKWASRIASSRQRLNSLFGDAVKDQMLTPALQLFWFKALELEDGFLSSLATVDTPRLLDQLHAHQAGLGKLIEELGDKWKFLLSQDLDLETDQLEVIDEIDKLVAETLAKVTPIRQKVLETTETVERRAKQTAEKIGSSNLAQMIAKAIEELLDVELGQPLDDAVDSTGTWISGKVGELKVSLSTHERNVLAYRGLLAREKGTVLAVFKQNREEVARYLRENDVEKAKVWRDQTVGALGDWADDRPSSGQNTDANAFTDEAEDLIEELWEATEDLDETFREEFEGLFWGPLASPRIEELIEIQKFKERVARVTGRGAAKVLAELAEQLEEEVEGAVGKALAPLASPPSGLDDAALEMVALKNKEFQATLREELERHLEQLLPVIADLREMYEEGRLGNDLGRDELEDELD